METTPQLTMHFCQVSTMDLLTILTGLSTVGLHKPEVRLVAKGEQHQTDGHYTL